MRFAILTLIACFISALSALAADISNVDVRQTGAGSTEITFSAEKLRSSDVKIFQISGNDPRIVVDFKGSSSKLLRSGNYTAKPDPTIEGIRGAVRNKDDIRFVIDLVPGSKLSSKNTLSDKVVISVIGTPTSPKLIAASATTKQQIPNNVPTPRLKPKVKLKPVIVIDAGHGGHDPGALGTKGLREKNVTLQAALELKNQLLATGRYKVVLTRGNDRYIEHDNRLRIARANGADLFISLHADATAGKTARGASVYTLADRAKNRSKKIVNSQNWIMDVNLSQQTDKVGDILVDLAQRNTASKSTEFADILISKLGTSSKLLRNTHRRAGYYVLLAPDVPAVLLELGFISNPQDEILLKSAQHRQKLMRSVVSAINQYFPR